MWRSCTVHAWHWLVVASGVPCTHHDHQPLPPPPHALLAPTCLHPITTHTHAPACPAHPPQGAGDQLALLQLRLQQLSTQLSEGLGNGLGLAEAGARLAALSAWHQATVEREAAAEAAGGSRGVRGRVWHGWECFGGARVCEGGEVGAGGSGGASAQGFRGRGRQAGGWGAFYAPGQPSTHRCDGGRPSCAHAHVARVCACIVCRKHEPRDC